MNDFLKDSAAEDALEARRRAEKIGKIKNSVQSSDGSEWEDALAERIARKVQKVKENSGLDAEDILKELDAEKQADTTQQADAFYEAPNMETAAEIQPEANINDESDVRKEAVSVAVNTVSDQPAEQEIPQKTETPMVRADENAPLKKNKKKKKKKKKTFKERFLGLFPQKGDSVGECIRKIVFLISIIAIVVCGYMVADYYIDLWHSKKINDQVMDMYWTYEDDEWTPPTVEPDVDDDADDRPIYHMLSGARKLLDINSEVVGVISIPDTPINNPVMQAKDNFKYLDLKINGDESRAGELFLDYRNHFDDVDDEGHLKFPNSDNLVIYGHNMGDDMMFGSLKYYQRNNNYYGEHPIIELNSNYCHYTYKIFSFFILDSEDKSDTKFDCWNKLNFGNEKEFYDFVNEAKRRTIRTNDVDVKYGDKLLTISTCNTLLGDRGRLIILARLVREGEDPLEGTQNSEANPNIKWPSIYYSYAETSVSYDPNAEFVPYGPAESDEKKKD